MRNSILLGAVAMSIAACSDSTSPTPAATSRASGTSAGRSADRQDNGARGAVFTATNGVSANAIVAFARAGDGSLTYAGTFNTGGKGIGGTTDPLASQYSLLLSDNAKLLFVANAGSNNISTFRVDGASLSLVGTTSSGGTLPVSLAIAHHTLYVLNAGSNSVTGFDIGEDGSLTADAGASSPLSAGAAGGAAVRASRDGQWLVVTEKGSRTIDVFKVAGDGALGSPVRSASNGVSPFGFDFVNGDQVAVSEAGSGAASLYDISNQGRLDVESPSVSTNGQAAPCWLIATTNGRFAYTANAGSGTISGYNIGAHGTMTLINASGVTGSTGAGSTPLDLDLAHGDQYLYVLESGAGRIGAFAVGPDGSLSPLAGIGGLPATSGLQGLAAY
jgi:6-phosphogluconolactonase (cycloisomerase 2 family)